MKFLIVDDAPQETDRLQAIVEEDGHQAFTASSGALALAIMPALQPDGVILDTDLPDMSGLDVLRKIRLDPDTRQAVVLLANPAPNDAEIIFGFSYCSDAHLGHPIEEIQLRRILKLMERPAEDADTSEKSDTPRFVNDMWSRKWDAEAKRNAEYSLEAALNAIRQFSVSPPPDTRKQSP